MAARHAETDIDPVEFFPLDRMKVPQKIRLSADKRMLIASRSPEEYLYRGTTKQFGRECFSRFLKLSDAGPEEILRFAQAWGMLGLCKHRLPAAHNLRSLDFFHRGILQLGCVEVRRERIHVWRRYARQFRAILAIWLELARGQPASSKQWSALGPSLREHAEESLSDQQKHVSAAITEALRVCGIHPIVATDEPRLRLGCSRKTRLLAALTMELAAILTDSRLLICSRCNQRHTAKRRPRPGEANYCRRCRRFANSIRVQRCRDKKKDSNSIERRTNVKARS